MARILHVLRPSGGGAFGHVRVLGREQIKRGYEVAVCGPHGEVADSLDVPLFEIAMGRAIDPRRDAAVVREVGRVYREFRPDLIHAHGSKGGVFARIARAALPGPPLIHTPHQYAFVNYFSSGGQQRAYRLIERALVPMTSIVLCVCEEEGRLAASIGAGRKVRVVHNGVQPLEPAPPPAELAEAVATADPLIVAVAELHERKGLATLIEAVALMRERHPRIRAIVAGEGDERLRLEAMRRDLGLEDAVLLPGFVSPVAGLLTAADAFVNPAWAEAFPYAVLEAMSLAKPCVVTDVGGTAEAIADGECGYVVPPRDAPLMAAALERLLADGELAERFGATARERLLQRFTRERMVAGTLAVYGELGLARP